MNNTNTNTSGDVNCFVCNLTCYLVYRVTGGWGWVGGVCLHIQEVPAYFTFNIWMNIHIKESSTLMSGDLHQ